MFYVDLKRSPYSIQSAVCILIFVLWGQQKYFEQTEKSPVHVCLYLSHVVRKPTFCICENKAADQLRGNREADQRLCFRYTDSIIPLLSKSDQSSSPLLWLYSSVLSDLVGNHNVCFLTSRLIYILDRLFLFWTPLDVET